MTVTKKWKVIHVGKDMKKLGHLFIGGGKQSDTVTVVNSLVISQKVTHRITIWSSNYTSGYTTKRTESKDLKRYMCINVHGIIACNSPKVETT